MRYGTMARRRTTVMRVELYSSASRDAASSDAARRALLLRECRWYARDARCVYVASYEARSMLICATREARCRVTLRARVFALMMPAAMPPPIITRTRVSRRRLEFDALPPRDAMPKSVITASLPRVAARRLARQMRTLRARVAFRHCLSPLSMPAIMTPAFEREMTRIAIECRRR